MNTVSYSYLLIVLLLAGIPCKAQVISTIAGNGIAGPVARPYGCAVDGDGNVYFSEGGTARVRRISRAGVLTTIAGNGTFGYTGDGGPATSASLFEVYGVAVDASHNVYIADAHSRVVRKVDPSGIITTFAGTGVAGYSGDGGAATSAKLYLPVGVATDNAGNVYIASADVIRKVDAAGIISTYAGTSVPGFSGDGGPATAAQLFDPESLATDNLGNLYVSGGDYVVRKIDAAGIIRTVAGIRASGYSGDGGPATAAGITYIPGLAADNVGNLFLCDQGNNVIRKVDASGIITTIAGNGFGAGLGVGSGFYSGDGGRADSATLHSPGGVAVDAVGNIYVSDSWNNAMRKVSAIAGMLHICSGDAVPLTVPVSAGKWVSSMPSVADVDSLTGIVTGVGAGSSTIYYSSGTDTATASVYVSLTPHAGIINGTDSMCIHTADTISSTIPGGIWKLSNGNAALRALTLTTIQRGIDTILYTVHYSCGIDTAQFSVTILQADPGIITGPDSACVGDTLTYSSSVPGGIWSVMDTLLATFISPGIVHILDSGFNYFDYRVNTALPGCFSSTDVSFKSAVAGYCTPVGVTSKETVVSKITIYPNPATDKLYIDMPPVQAESSITLSDLCGRVLTGKTVVPNTNKVEVDLQLPTGVYVLRIQGDGTAETHMIVVN